MNFLSTVTHDRLGLIVAGTVLLSLVALAVIASLFALLGLTGGLVIGGRELADKKKWGSFLVLLLVVAFGAGVGLSSVDQQISNGDNEIRNNLVSNLKQKYDLKTVDFDSNDYRLLDEEHYANVNAGSANAQKIILITNDGKQALFILKQDSKTNEPTLSEMLGTAGAPQPSLSSITRH